MKRSSIAAAVTIAAATALSFPSLALAHDEVVGSSPEEGTTVQAGVLDLGLTFNEDIMATPDNSGEEFSLVSPDVSTSYQLAGACLSVSGATVSTKVNLDKPGDYTLNWRSVSNDGHPSEGQLHFTVANDNGYKASDIASGIKNTGCKVVVAIADVTAVPVVISARVPAADTHASNTALAFGYGFAGFGAAMLAGFGLLVAGNRKR